MLDTTAEIPRRSAFGEIFDDLSVEVRGLASSVDAEDRLVLVPLDNCGLLDIRGAGLAQATGVNLTRNGQVQRVGEVLVAQLRPDNWMAVARSQAAVATFGDRTVADPGTGLVTATDVSHGRACLLLGGTRATEVLERLCGLDFAEASFPHAHSAMTSLAKVRALIIRWDIGRQPAYFVGVERSVAVYVAQAIRTEMEACCPSTWGTRAGMDSWPSVEGAND